MLTESDGTVKKLLIAAGSVAAAAAVWFVASRRGCGCFSKGGAVAAAKGAGSKRLDAIVISGPSGVGKGTLITRLRTEHPNSFGFSVSHTTRAPRAGESDGKDYHFVSRDVMTAMVANGEFLENCDVHGNMYGTSKAALQKVRDEGRVAIIEMDVQGAQKLKAQQGDLVFHYMFITAPLEALEERITKRGADSPEKTRVRLETARKEFEFLQANPTFFDSVLTNDDLDATYAKLLSTLKAAGVAL